jgi:putative tricarboxylic transport membrane protein
MFARQLAKLALVRPGILVPVVLAITFIGAFQGSRDWGDLYVLLGTGALGFFMKRLGWPRPPLILGFVLGVIFERYMFITTELYGIAWLARPFVAIMLLISLYGLIAPALRRWLVSRKAGGGERTRVRFGLARDVNMFDVLFTVTFVALFVTALVISSNWAHGARLIPQIISWTGVIAGCILLVSQLFVRFESSGGHDGRDGGGLQFDLSGEFEGLARATVIRRAFAYFGWSVFFIVAAWIIGLLPAVAVFVAGYMRFTSRETTATALIAAAAVTLLSYLLFHWLLVIPWPDAWLGDLFPELRAVRALRLF